MTSPQSEVFDDFDLDMFTPTEAEFPTNPIDTVKAMHEDFLKAFLELDLESNPPPEPLTEEIRQKRMEELIQLYPMPSEDLPLEQQWWLNLPSYQQQPVMDIYNCDPSNENSLCSLGICAVCCPQPELADMVEVVQYDASDFNETLASLGATVVQKPNVEEEAVLPWDEIHDWITQSH
ncbi:hypothetical protein BDZ94DRAFT_50372 [Collybia nuda]|uniref:Uncharacterized protein n=1 Tax=Collybia nuda TaxID=64659 RepID=A0A9P5YD34_9AGAR|nr:hypothetical protein BDZ94DRAFT_50372 [Collybia nuda]